MAIKKILQQQQQHRKIDRLQAYKSDLKRVLLSLEDHNDEPVLEEHIHSLIGEIDYKIIEVLDGGLSSK